MSPGCIRAGRNGSPVSEASVESPMKSVGPIAEKESRRP